MAKVKFNTSKLVKELRNVVGDASRNDKFLKEAGDFITTRIKGFARKGRPLNDTRSFPPLFRDTIEARKRIAESTLRTHPAFRPSKSNLTVTGQLIDAVSFRRIRARRFEIFIAPSERDGGDEPNNQKLAGYLEKIGFTIFDKEGIESDGKIPRRFKKLLLRFLRKELKRK